MRRCVAGSIPGIAIDLAAWSRIRLPWGKSRQPRISDEESMDSENVDTLLREMFDEFISLCAEDPSLEIRALWNHSARPDGRPERGFAVWLPADADGVYAGVVIHRTSDGLGSHGEAGRVQAERTYHLFAWPNVAVRDGVIEVDERSLASSYEAAHEIVAQLRRLVEAVRRD